METYFPLESAIDSARVMHSDDLCISIDTALLVALTLHQDDGVLPLYDQHPVVQMWRGHVPFLIDSYALPLMDELQDRAAVGDPTVRRTAVHLEEMRLRFTTHMEYSLEDNMANISRGERRPQWVGRPEFHAAHRSALLRKRMPFYLDPFGDTSPNIPLFYPTGSVL